MGELMQTFKGMIIPDPGNKLVGNLIKNTSKVYNTHKEAGEWIWIELNLNWNVGKKCRGEVHTQCAIVECGVETNAKYFLGEQYLCLNCYNKAALEIEPRMSQQDFWGV
jgi:hypothetical protein